MASTDFTKEKTGRLSLPVQTEEEIRREVAIVADREYLRTAATAAATFSGLYLLTGVVDAYLNALPQSPLLVVIGLVCSILSAMAWVLIRHAQRAGRLAQAGRASLMAPVILFLGAAYCMARLYLVRAPVNLVEFMFLLILGGTFLRSRRTLLMYHAVVLGGGAWSVLGILDSTHMVSWWVRIIGALALSWVVHLLMNRQLRASEEARVQDRQHAQECQRLAKDLHEALEQVSTLQGLIPICCYCKRVRNDHGYWEQVESFVRDHSEAEFSHGICPDCMNKLEKDLGE